MPAIAELEWVRETRAAEMTAHRRAETAVGQWPAAALTPCGAVSDGGEGLRKGKVPDLTDLAARGRGRVFVDVGGNVRARVRARACAFVCLCVGVRPCERSIKASSMRRRLHWLRACIA